VADCLGVLAEEKKQALSVEIADQLIVEADRDTLRSALMNILDNAIKYTPAEGHIRVVVKRRQDEAVVEVGDDGPGIPLEHREKIFERFYRVEKARSSETGGAGLGLAIARWAVEINGGRIELESEEGRGSMFRIVLPERKGGGGE
jgi:signal transduction histidine kinase